MSKPKPENKPSIFSVFDGAVTPRDKYLDRMEREDRVWETMGLLTLRGLRTKLGLRLTQG